MKSFVAHNEMGKSLLTKIFYFPGLLLLSMMIVLPSSYQYFKGVLIFVVSVEVLFSINYSLKLKMHPNIFYLFIFYISLGLLYGVYGLLRHNPGVIPITKEVVLYVIFYMILISGIVDYTSLRYIHKTLIFSMVILCIYIVISILYAYGIWPDWLYLNLKTTTSEQGVNTGFLRLYGRFNTSFSSFPSLLFLQPYLFCFLIADSGKKSKLMWFLFLIMTVIMVFVGRRILLMIALSFPFIIIITLTLIRKNNALKVKRWKSVLFYLTLIFLCLSVIFMEVSDLSVHSIIDHVVTNFHAKQMTPAGKVVSNVRIDTIVQLFKGWTESPIFGFGNGASYSKFIRSTTEPWNYEVSYMHYLYSWGIVGITLYGMGIIFIIRRLIKIYKENSVYSSYAISSLMGMAAFLIGNATNPYLLKIDYLFIIFLPVAIINLHYLSHKYLIA